MIVMMSVIVALGRTSGQKSNRYWRSCWWRKVIIVTAGLCLVLIGTMYGIGQWYIWSQRDRPVIMGASFVADYASYLGLDPHQTLSAMLDNLHVKRLRLVSYWSDIERTRGQYNFSELDWEFQQAQAHHARISLAIGLRQPRWPECHVPGWAIGEPDSVWRPQVMNFIRAVVNRYKANPTLESYQLENEYFLTAFGTCADYSRQRLIDEAGLVRQLDPQRTLIISRSQNAVGWPVNEPHADKYAISIYRRVWSTNINRYLQYPFPAWYYAFLAGAERLWSGKDTAIHELQAEPWLPDGQTILTSSLAEQNNTMDKERFNATVDFGKATGMKRIDLWGAEYWYYRKTVLHQPDIWNAARQVYK